MLIELNHSLFLAINAPAHPSALAVGAALFCATWLVYAAATLLVALWIWGREDARGGLLATVMAVIVALVVNQLLGALWYEPRPFMAGLGHNFAHHALDNSFPSDHGTFMWSLGFALLLTRASPGWGIIVVLTGFLVAWARIYLGIHFPADMAASFLVGIGAGALARAMTPACERRLLPVTQRSYDAGLHLLRLSPRLFPRRTA